MHSVWFGEFMGTLVLVLLGTGVNAGVTLRKSYAADAGWMVVTTGWALAVMCGVLVAQAFGSPGAYLNPAITLASAVANGDYTQLASFWSAQMLGAMAGAALMALHYAPHWALTPDADAKLRRVLHLRRGAQSARELHQRSNRHDDAGGCSNCDLFAWRVDDGAGARRLVSGWWAVWYGASGSRWAAPPAMPSTRRAIWARA